MIPHCANCRFDGQQDWNTTNNRCKGRDRDEGDGDDSPCRVEAEYGTEYRYFMPVDEFCAERTLDSLLQRFDALEFRVAQIERWMRGPA